MAFSVTPQNKNKCCCSCKYCLYDKTPCVICIEHHWHYDICNRQYQSKYNHPNNTLFGKQFFQTFIRKEKLKTAGSNAKQN